MSLLDFETTDVAEIKENTELLKSRFLTAEKFSHLVEELVWKDDIKYIDAIMIICDELDIDPENLTKLELISPHVYSELQKEATSDGYLKATATLI